MKLTKYELEVLMAYSATQTEQTTDEAYASLESKGLLQLGTGDIFEISPKGEELVKKILESP